LIYDKADLYYIQAVRNSLTPKRNAMVAQKPELEQKRAELEAKPIPLSPEDQAELDHVTEELLYDDFYVNLVQWTELKAAKDEDPLARRLAVARMAEAIYPLRELGEAGAKQEHHYLESLKDEARLLQTTWVSDSEHDRQSAALPKLNLWTPCSPSLVAAKAREMLDKQLG
jgi:hypothetical protein